MTRLRNLAFALLGAVVLQAGPALAVCNQKTASQADRDLWNTHGCWQAFFLWQYQAYDMSGSDWAGRGWDDACNVNKEYPKHWNASYLLTYGLQDNNSFSFHGTVDYRGTAERWDNAYHDDLYHAPTDDTSIFGSWTYHFFGSNEVDTSCLLYDPNLKPNANPGSRGGDFEHEGWHGWMDLYDWDNGSCGGHRCGPVGNCSASGCDYFYFHGIGAYAFGAMWENDGTANRFHSPNQVQVEYLCDVADFPVWWVPNSVRLAAQADANQRASQRFINGPGYFCGSPRPW